jgi:hypothetical protein
VEVDPVADGVPVPGALEQSEVAPAVLVPVAVPVAADAVVDPVLADPVAPVDPVMVDPVLADPVAPVDPVVADPVVDPVVVDAVVADVVDLVGDVGGVSGGADPGVEVAGVDESVDPVVVDPVPGRGGPQPLPWWRSTTISVEPADPGVVDVVVPGGVRDTGVGELPVEVWALSGPGGVPGRAGARREESDLPSSLLARRSSGPSLLHRGSSFFVFSWPSSSARS